jgi:hypothetical protein
MRSSSGATVRVRLGWRVVGSYRPEDGGSGVTADFALIDKAWSLAANSRFFLTESRSDHEAIAESDHPFGRRDIQQWLLERGTREQLIEWLVWNDGNGVYTDEDSIAEGYGQLTLEAARATMKTILRREMEE